MSGWVSALPQMGMALLVLFVPGTLLLLAAGVPWRRALLFAPAPSAGVVGAIGIAADLVGVRFGLPVVAVATLLGCAGVALLTLLLRRLRHGRQPRVDAAAERPRDHSRDLALPGALAVAALVIGIRVAAALGGPENVSQTFDAVFHLNTTRFIVATGQGSSLRLLGWGNGTGGFYPAVWHDMAALVAYDGNVLAATQALALVVSAVVWPLSVLVLVERLLGRRWSVLFGTAALLSGLGVFPAKMLDFGVLYPFLLGIALMPMLVALAHIATGPLEERGGFRGLALWIACGFGAIGLALAHPGVLLAFLIIAAPLVVRRGYAIGRARWARGRRISTAVVAVGAVAALLAAAKVLNGSATVAAMRSTDWPRIGSPSQAFGAWLFVSPHQFDIPWAVAALTIVGMGVAIATRGLRWLVVAHVLLAIPYVFAAGIDSPLSQSITAFWYNDSVRLGALAPVTAVPLAAVGLSWAIDSAARFVPVVVARVRWLRPRRRLVAASVAVLTLGLAALTSDPASAEMYALTASRYVMPDHPLDRTVLSTNELALLEKLPTLVPPGTRLAVNPWDGSGLAYAVAGVPVMVPQLGGYPSGEVATVAEGLASARQSPAVCRAVHDLHLTYALDFGTPLWRDDRAYAYPGLLDLSGSSSVQLVTSVGRARLYKITGCGTAP